MKKFLCLLATLAILAGCGSSQHIKYSKHADWDIPDPQPAEIQREAPTKEAANSEISWISSFGNKNIKKAIEEDKHILLYFYNDWCPYCFKMVKETFSSEPIITLVNRNFYAFRIDVESLTPAQMKMFGAERVPMLLVLKPSPNPENAEIETLQGFQDSDVTFLFLLGAIK